MIPKKEHAVRNKITNANTQCCQLHQLDGKNDNSVQNISSPILSGWNIQKVFQLKWSNSDHTEI